MSISLPTAYRAAWIFPVAAPPLRNGILEINAAGRIAAVRAGRDGDAIDLGEVALVPALVNAHVHLEFSDLAQPVGPPRPFAQWVKNVVAHRRRRIEPIETILCRGLDEASRTGTAAVGEIATSEVPPALFQDGPEAILFREVIGPIADHWPDLLATADRFLTTAGSASVTPGLSPHAPYTVPQELFERLIDIAVRHAAPVAVHLAETAAERELFASGTGELATMLQSLDLWRPELHPPGRRPLDWLRMLEKARRGLVVHGNYLDDEELAFLARHENLSLVYCPRTHAYFGHPPHPFRRLLGRGGRVALGTDGRSSNPDLSLWRECTFLRERHPDLRSDTILDLATRRGAEALGVEDRHGVLAPGRPANFLAVSLGDARDDNPPDLFAPGRDLPRVFRHGIELDCHDGGPACPH
jgi:cytosine/adenosine deaminase-related metal-dependent hydrolase